MTLVFEHHPTPGKWVWPCCLVAVLSIALAACGQAIAMDAPREAAALRRPGTPGAKPPVTAVNSPGVVRKVTQGKGAQESLDRSRVPGEGKEQRKPRANKRAATPRKSSAGRRTAPIPPGTNTEAQALRAEACKKRIEATLQPARIVQLAEECGKAMSDDIQTAEFRRIGNDARQVLDVQRSAGLSADLFAHPEGDADFQALVLQAARGDKLASYRIAQAYRAGQLGVQASTRRMEQWLRFTAELGDGRASWELAEYYNYGGLVADAAKYEKKAEDLGYRPGVRLPSRGY